MSVRLEMALWALAALAGVGFSAIFAGVETGVYCLNRIRLRLRSDSGERRARTLLQLLRRQRSLLATLLIGTNMAGYLGSSAIVALFSYTDRPEWQIAVIVPLIFAPLLLIFGEILPKNIFQAYSDRYTYSFAGLLRWMRRILTFTGLLPLVEGVSRLLIRLTGAKSLGPADDLFHPRQQVGRLIRETSHAGTLTAYQSYLVDRVMNLRNVRVAQAMVPLAKVRAAPSNVSRQQFLARLEAHPFSRVPLFEDRPSRIVGVVDANAVLASDQLDRPVAELAYDPPRIRPDATVAHALFALQRAGRTVGIVTDKSGAAVGLVTLKDLVEEIVGEIEEW